MAGFKREEIRVLVDNHGHLRTRGERPVQGNKWSRFQKDLQLPSDCNVDGIRAKFENEALTITLPKKHPSPKAAPTPAPPMPEPRRPSTAPPQKPPPALPEPAKPTVLPPVSSQKSFPDRRPSPPRKPSDVPAPARPAPPVPAPAPAPKLESPDEWVKEEAKKAQAAAQEEEKRMEREARGKMEEDRKMAEEMKKPKEGAGMLGDMDMAQQKRRRGLLVNVAVAVVVLVGITVYVWRNLSAAVGGDGSGDVGTGSYGDEM
jgi:hypothetical protein